MNQRKLRIEHLEDKRLLTILWENEFSTGLNDPNFDTVYQDNAAIAQSIAQSIVHRAIADWESVIQSFNYTDPALNDTFTVSISAGQVGFPASAGSYTAEAVSGLPISADIKMDNDGGGFGWYFDETPYATSHLLRFSLN